MRDIRKLLHYIVCAAALAAALLLTGCGHFLPTFLDTSSDDALLTLDLSGKSEAELADLSRYSNLQELNLSGMSITDISPLSGLTGLTVLDVRGTGLTPEMYEELAAALPDCEIIWSVPIGSETYDSSLTELVLPDCSAEELAMLRYFPHLETVDISACTDDDAVYNICRDFPNLTVLRAVTLCGIRFPASTETADLSDCGITGPEELSGIEYLSRLKTVDLTGSSRTLDEMLAFRQTYPWLTFLFSFEMEGKAVDGRTEELDLSGTRITDLETLRSELSLLPSLRHLELCGCGLSNEDCASLRDEFSDVEIVWELNLNGYVVRTDAQVFPAPESNAWHVLEDGTVQQLRYCTDLRVLDLGNHDISDLSFLEYLPELRVLLLSENAVIDLTPVSSLRELRYLELHLNYYIKDLSPLAGLQKLTDLNLSYLGQVTDYTALSSLPALQRLWLVRCGLKNEETEEIRSMVPEGCEVFISETDSSTGGGWHDGEAWPAIQTALSTGEVTAQFD